MTNSTFSPFEDRQSRDIRNSLSEGLAHALETGQDEKLTICRESFQAMVLDQDHQDYITERLAAYEKAIEAIGDKLADPIDRAVSLWDLGLFFEVHEVLEHAWYDAEDEMKLTLQALIRAAGVYIKREYGFTDAAERIAAKAVPILEENRQLLQNHFDPDLLIKALKNPVPPPTLGSTPE
jgi:hypothetical protein